MSQAIYTFDGNFGPMHGQIDDTRHQSHLPPDLALFVRKLEDVHSSAGKFKKLSDGLFCGIGLDAGIGLIPVVGGLPQDVEPCSWHSNLCIPHSRLNTQLLGSKWHQSIRFVFLP